MRDEHQQGIGRAIARLREQQGWSQRELATWVGLDQSAVSRIEAGRRRVSAAELQRFVEAFHVSADDLLLGLTDGDAPRADAPAGYALPLPSPSAQVEYAVESRLEPDSYLAAGGAGPGFDVSFAGAAEAGAPRLGDDVHAPDRGDAEVREHGDLAPWDVAAAEPPGSPASGLIPPEIDRMGRNDPVGGALSLRVAARSRPEARLPVRPGAGVERALLAAGAPVPATSSPVAPRPAASFARLRDLPPETAAVVRDWFELRRLAGGGDPALAWSTGHSAEGRPARFSGPVQPSARGSLGGDVLYDRVARFWRSELHVEPDDGPLPDLVPLLEDGLGAQVIVARVAGPETAFDGMDRPVCAAFTADGVPFLFVNAARPVVLQRFALAHALAHLVLGHGDVVDGRIHWSRNNPREAAANDFAEELLAPVRAVRRWYERRGEPRPEVETLLELGNAFGISAWAALYRSRAAQRLHDKQFAKLNQELRRLEWELLPRQAFLGGLRDTLTLLTPGECLPPGAYGRPAVLRVPAAMRAWAFAAVRGGGLSVERAAALLRLDARELAAQLARLGVE